jgi:hypothetical protein
MSEPVFTPGPWTACFTLENRIPLSFEITANPHGSVRPIVACTWDYSIGREETETLKANAYLIAAAPELYEALEGMCDANGEFHASKYSSEAGIKARAALAKARGDAQ